MLSFDQIAEACAKDVRKIDVEKKEDKDVNTDKKTSEKRKEKNQ